MCVYHVAGSSDTQGGMYAPQSIALHTAWTGWRMVAVPATFRSRLWQPPAPVLHTSYYSPSEQIAKDDIT